MEPFKPVAFSFDASSVLAHAFATLGDSILLRTHEAHRLGVADEAWTAVEATGQRAPRPRRTWAHDATLESLTGLGCFQIWA